MNLKQTDHTFIIEGLFSSGVVAGFTKPNIPGKMPQDIFKAVSFLGYVPELAYMNQIHTDIVNRVHGPAHLDCDGIFTNKPGLILVVKTADCMPIILSNEDGEIGVVHMGWRSARAGILNNIRKDLSGYKAVLGVGMRKCCYEVGKEFLDFTGMKRYVNELNGKLFFDPIGFAKQELTGHGMKDDNIFDLGICSICSEQGFFSNRKTGTKDRTLSFIVKRS